MSESVAVELLLGREAIAPSPVAVEEIRIDGEDLLGATEEAEIDGRATKVLAELFVLALTVLPSGGDDGQRAVDPQPRQDFVEHGLQALGAEKAKWRHETQSYNVLARSRKARENP